MTQGPLIADHSSCPYTNVHSHCLSPSDRPARATAGVVSATFRAVEFGGSCFWWSVKIKCFW